KAIGKSQEASLVVKRFNSASACARTGIFRQGWSIHPTESGGSCSRTHAIIRHSADSSRFAAGIYGHRRAVGWSEQTVARAICGWSLRLSLIPEQKTG